MFELNGKFVGKFGTEGSNLGEFHLPSSVAVLSNGQLLCLNGVTIASRYWSIHCPLHKKKKQKTGNYRIILQGCKIYFSFHLFNFVECFSGGKGGWETKTNLCLY